MAVAVFVRTVADPARFWGNGPFSAHCVLPLLSWWTVHLKDEPGDRSHGIRLQVELEGVPVGKLVWHAAVAPPPQWP